MSPDVHWPASVVIGVGNPMRRDDGVGHVAIEALRKRDRLGVDVSLIPSDGEPTRLLELWKDRDRAVVIDAAKAGAAPGVIHRINVGVDPMPAWSATTSSHATGLAEAVALSRQLDSLPGDLVIFGVEPDDVSMGEGLSTRVADALGRLVVQVEGWLETGSTG